MAKRRKRRPASSLHRALLYRNRHHYDGLLEFQGGGCGICGRPPGKRRLDLDHDHKTMEIRGLLCTTCNRRLTGRITIGWLKDAAEYLERPPFQTYSRLHPPQGDIA